MTLSVCGTTRGRAAACVVSCAWSTFRRDTYGDILDILWRVLGREGLCYKYRDNPFTTTHTTRYTMAIIFSVLLLLVFCIYTEGSMRYNVTEGLSAWAIIGNVAEDAGLPQKYGAFVTSQLRFSFLSQTARWRDIFSIDHTTGVLRVGEQELDRDSICPKQVLCEVPLRIQVEKPYFQIILLTVGIADVNDVTPHFDVTSVTRALSEASLPGTTLTMPSAEDTDSPVNGVQSYRLSGSSLFSVDWSADNRVWLKLTGRLDREMTDSISLRLVAVDGGNPARTSLINVHIVISDANDNSPRFENTTYDVYVRENNAQTTPLMTFTATDADIDSNGQVMYALAEKSSEQFGDLFHINRQTGALYVDGVLDYETTERIVLTVVAHDANPDSRDFAKVTVHVVDVNDNAPQITINDPSADGSVSVSEGAPIGEFVAHVTVIDPDGGDNARFNCSLEHPHFAIVRLYETEFKLVTTTSLDRETVSQYVDVFFVCVDGGHSPQTSTESIVVMISDTNDNSPRFTQSVYSVTLNENNAIGAFITSVLAEDADSGDNAACVYSLQGAMRDMFHLDANSGNLTASVSLDHERTSRIQLSVTAADRGQPSLTATATIIIDVDDVDDEIAEFSSPHYYFSLVENQHSGASVDRVYVTDNDTDPYNRFTLLIEPNSTVSDVFSLDATSQTIFAKKSLDREQQAQYDFRVLAISATLPAVTSTALVTVTVTDENDHDPLFLFPSVHNNSVTAWSGSQPGDIVAVVRATDNDAGENALLSFTTLTMNDVFGINSNTGAVHVVQPLLKFDGNTLEVRIQVKDSGPVPRGANATLYIRIDSSLRRHVSVVASSNLTIVICIAVVSTLFVIILLFAIFCLLRTREDPNNKTNKYNCVAHAMERNMLSAEQQKADVENIQIRNSLGPKTLRQDSFMSATCSENSVSSSLQLTATGIASSLTPGKIISLTPVSPPFVQTSVRCKLSDDVRSAPKRPPRAPRSSMRTCSQGGDKDSDSGCSADMSHADSGRSSDQTRLAQTQQLMRPLEASRASWRDRDVSDSSDSSLQQIGLHNGIMMDCRQENIWSRELDAPCVNGDPCLVNGTVELETALPYELHV